MQTEIWNKICWKKNTVFHYLKRINQMFRFKNNEKWGTKLCKLEMLASPTRIHWEWVEIKHIRFFYVTVRSAWFSKVLVISNNVIAATKLLISVRKSRLVVTSQRWSAHRVNFNKQEKMYSQATSFFNNALAPLLFYLYKMMKYLFLRSD